MVMFDEKGRLILKYKPEIDREKEAKKWKRKLPAIYKQTCKQLNIPERENVKNYELVYDKTFPLWAAIYMREQKIITGQKWHTLSDEEKERVLKHEFVHAITGREDIPNNLED